MESFSSTATWMILLRVAALSSKVPVQPRMSTAMPMAIVLCLRGRKTAVRPRANRTKRKRNQMGQGKDWLSTVCCYRPEMYWQLSRFGCWFQQRDRPHQVDCSRAPGRPQWVSYGESKRTDAPAQGCSALEQGMWRGPSWGEAAQKCKWLLVPSTMTGLRRCQVPQHTGESLPQGSPGPPPLSPLDWRMQGTEKWENMLDSGRRHGCQNKERNEELRTECLWLRSRGQKGNGDVDKDSTVDQQDIPVRSDLIKLKSCICQQSSLFSSWTTQVNLADPKQEAEWSFVYRKWDQYEWGRREVSFLVAAAQPVNPPLLPPVDQKFLPWARVASGKFLQVLVQCWRWSPDSKR